MLTLDLHMIPFIIVYFLLLGAVFLICKCKKKMFQPYYALCVLYFLLLFKVTICPITYLREAYRGSIDVDLIYAIQWIPFKTLWDTIQAGTWGVQILGNILLLLPIPVLFSVKSNTVFPLWKTICVGMFVSLGIELVQFIINVVGYFPTHVIDVDDFIFNVLGVLIGFAVSVIMKKIGVLQWFNRLVIFGDKEK